MSASQFKEQLRAQGITISSCARAHGYKPRAVLMVLNGQYKGHYGQAHEIAVKAGLKSPAATAN